MGLYTRFFVRGAFAPAVRSRNGSCAGINRRLWRLLVEGRRRRVPGGGLCQVLRYLRRGRHGAGRNSPCQLMRYTGAIRARLPHLVLGGTGFIGRHVAVAIARAGDQVTIASRYPPKFEFPADVRSRISWAYVDVASADWWNHWRLRLRVMGLRLMRWRRG